MALPRGTFAFIRRTTMGSQQFIGEDHIVHTPKDEDLRIKVGELLTSSPRRKQTDYKVFPRSGV